ncbi:UDP-N-acetylmuramoyl-tripeptide--D-alanyl-D-alanine ligase [Puia dinghuensis]|uniref:UDP-N-acetylmuramoyl-tripeptide--D-alanyl-D-alanine ligase n=2 Tax=Puia dinghuensis TaxID=1792502 RepID=A0A8J2UIX6_9BACT|nr:UDP-N-acetylmuramoyl-tripeptide--D-alanyl-D-alanine ligase [Puia dinghuensis]
MTIELLYDLYQRYPSVQTDTRQLKQGDLFFALKGPNFNGNAFALRALELGAAYAIVDEPVVSPSVSATPVANDRIIQVHDVLFTLHQLALYHRRHFDIPFIAITGSNGKTTTKELIHAVLASTFQTYTTKGNLNNHIGIPLTILSVHRDAEFAVIEMGANHQKEIEGYCRYTLPTHGIITNIGRAHLEGFGGVDGVRKGKGELYDYLRDEGGSAFVFRDSEDLRQMSRGIPHIITYGTADADVVGKVAPSEDSFLHVEITRGAIAGVVPTQLVGDYNLPNVLVAVAVGKHFGVSDAKIRQAITQYTPSNSRSQLIERDGNHIILDAYNANPSSMRAAIENFARLATDGGEKVLVLGAMAELGPESVNEHRGIVELIGEYPWAQVVLVGGDFLKVEHPYLSFANSAEAAKWYGGAGLKGAWVLIKGSRSSRMEEVLARTPGVS